ncbi:MAG: hypothetical protein H5T69_12505 [Chloroflexi bacterium]|nr:hypothetical protein [Chloroflexota bacterium]
MAFNDQTRFDVLQCPQCGAGLEGASEGYVVCQYCGASLVIRQGGGEAGPQEAVRGMRLRQFVYTDAQGTGLEMFRMLMPVGWEFQGGCHWMLDNPGMPATLGFQMRNPHGAEAFEVLPNMNFTWNNNPMTRMMFPVGSRYFGAEVRPPMGARQAMQELVLPRYRSGVQNLRVLALELQPDLPHLVKAEAVVEGGSAEGAKAHIRYTWGQTALEEEIYSVVEVFRAPIVTMFGAYEAIFWFVDYLFSFRTTAGHLKAMTDLFTVMIKSLQVNPYWYAAYKSIVQFLAQQQIQRIYHIGQIGQIMAQAGREIREQNLNDWYRRQEIWDRLAEDRSRAIRGVDAFYDPHREQVVELPSGYGHAWANNLGEYIVTDNPNFNPNLHSNLHWEPMSPP